MALSPSTRRAVTRAIEALHNEVGGAQEYKDLLSSMKTAVGSGAGEDAPAPSDAPARDGEDDDYSFDTAQRRHGERLKAADEAATDAKPDGGEDK